MKNFKYIGQQPHNSTIIVGEGETRVKKDLRLSDGDTAVLPEDHPVVAALFRQGLLVVEKSISTNKKTEDAS